MGIDFVKKTVFCSHLVLKRHKIVCFVKGISKVCRLIKDLAFFQFEKTKANYNTYSLYKIIDTDSNKWIWLFNFFPQKEY